MCTVIGTTTGAEDTQDTDESVDSESTGSNDPNPAVCSNGAGTCEVSKTPYTTHARCTCEPEGWGEIGEEAGGDGAVEGTLMSEEELLQWYEELLEDCQPVEKPVER